MQNSWHTVVGNENVNIAYDNFLSFTKMYNTHCPGSTEQPEVLQISLLKPGLKSMYQENHLYKAVLSSR